MISLQAKLYGRVVKTSVYRQILFIFIVLTSKNIVARWISRVIFLKMVPNFEKGRNIPGNVPGNVPDPSLEMTILCSERSRNNLDFLNTKKAESKIEND